MSTALDPRAALIDRLADALTVAERRPSCQLSAEETARLIASWRAGRMDDDEIFAHHLAELGTDAEGLAARLHPSARPAPNALDWVDELLEIDSHPGPMPELDPVRYGVQELDRLPFSDFHRPFLAWFDAELSRLLSQPEVSIDLSARARREILTGFAGVLLNVTLRGLLEDRAISQNAGHSAEAHQASHRSPDGRHRTFSRFPVLARDVHRVAGQQMRHLGEVLTRLSRDLPQLTRLGLATGDHTLAGLTSGAGDSHAGGRSVTLLTWTDESRLVYRPQPGGMFEAMHRVSQLLRQADGERLIVPRSLAIDGHTWVEYLQHEPGPPDQTFYHRLGSLLGTAWALGSRDLHMENVIATNRGPAPVDLETMLSAPAFHPSPKRAANVALDAVNSGIVGSGILPVLASVSGSEVDVSVLSGGLVTSEVDVEMLVDADDPAARIELSRVRSGQRRNLPRNGDAASALEHLDDLCAGATEAVQALRSQRASVIAALRNGGEDSTASYPVRVVVRPTSLYSLLLHQARHPQHLRSGLAREHLLRKLHSSATSGAPYLSADLVTSEIHQLLDGDVPFFAVGADRDQLTGPDFTTPLSPVGRSPLSVASGQLALATSARVAEELGVAMEVSKSALGERPGGTEPPTNGVGARSSATTLEVVAPERRRASTLVGENSAVLDTSRTSALLANLVETFAKRALLGDHDASWTGLCSTTNSTALSLRPLGTGLFDGLAGIGLALALAGEALDDDLAKSLAQRALIPVAEELERWIETPRGPVGAHSGAGGLAYALGIYSSLARRSGRPLTPSPSGSSSRWPDLIEAYLDRATEQVQTDPYLDITSGAAGAIAVALALGRVDLASSDEVRGLVDAAVRRLEVTSTHHLEGTARAWPTGDAGVHLGGFSHGASGVGWAVARAASDLAEDRYENLARQALAFDDVLLSPKTGLWRDARPEWSHVKAYPVHWCHGAAGIALARGQSARFLADRGLALDAEAALDAVLSHELPANDSLCHGTLGNAAVITEVAPNRLHPAVRGYLAECEDHLLNNNFRPGLGLSATSAPGLMVGFAGLIQHLARRLRPDLPHVLWLDTP